MLDCEEEEKENEDWLPPPPKISHPAGVLAENSTIKELRYTKTFPLQLSQFDFELLLVPFEMASLSILRAPLTANFSYQWFCAYRLMKQELLSCAQSAEDILRDIEESAKGEVGKSLQPSLDAIADQPSRPHNERAKIVISVQDKDGLKQFRIYMVHSSENWVTNLF